MPKMLTLKISDITVGERARDDYGDLESLTASIKDKGILQPITVSEDYMLLAGGRRLVAAKDAGLIEIPALIYQMEGTLEDIDVMEIELLENVIRKDFTWIEQSRLIKKIDDYMRSKNKEWGQRSTAKLLDKSLGDVNKQIQLANYADAVPEIAQMKTAADGIKAINKLEEAVVINELKKRHEESAPTSVSNLVRLADHNYLIKDVFDGMKDLKDTPIDFIECDPPYGIDLQDMKKKEGEVHIELEAYTEVDKTEYKVFLNKLTRGLYQAAGDHCWLVFWYGPTWHCEVKQALLEAKWKVNEIPGIWNKGQGQTMQPNTNLANTYEPFFICRKGNPVLKQQGRANIFTFPPVHGGKKYHPTQRPGDLIDEILNTFAYPDSIVFSPFLGSGETLLGVYRSKMKGFGYDLETQYKDRFLVEVTKMEM